jgi:SAM-dependent methyltransferase
MQAHFPVVRCLDCGLVYADEHFKQRDLVTFYSGDYYARAYVCHPPEIDSKIAADYVRAFDHVDRALGGGRILDFGSARGTFLAELRNRGYEDRWALEGIDINPDEVRMGVESGLPIREGALKDAPYAPGTFDAITAFSVIEHLQRPDAELEALARFLRPGGELLIIVPSGNCLILKMAILGSRLLGRRVQGFTDNVFHEEHLYYFTRPTMTQALRAAGLEPRVWFHTPSYLETHPPGVLIKIGAYGLRVASWALRQQTMLGVVARKRG